MHKRRPEAKVNFVWPRLIKKKHTTLPIFATSLSRPQRPMKHINAFEHSSPSKLVQIPDCPRHSWHTNSNQHNRTLAMLGNLLYIQPSSSLALTTHHVDLGRLKVMGSLQRGSVKTDSKVLAREQIDRRD